MVERKYPRMEKLIHRRQVLNMTRAELGEKCGVSKYTITEYESGGRVPKVDTMVKIAEALNCTVNDLLNVEEYSPLTSEYFEVRHGSCGAIHNGCFVGSIKRGFWKIPKAEYSSGGAVRTS